MQTWHCIALIVLSIAVFLYASFVDEINKTAETSLTSLSEVSEPGLEKKGTDSDHNFSSSWAETLLTLDSAIDEDYAISFHQEALESNLLLSTILNELEKSPVAFEMILGPFTNEIFSENKLEILSSLILIRPKSKRSLHVICKGHSSRAANLLSELIVRNYNRLVTSESTESPLPNSLVKKLKVVKEYEKQLDDLKVTIQEELGGSPEESVEVMAIRSEIMQVDQEITEVKQHLLKIDQIHKNGQNPTEYLHIPPVRDYGQVAQVADILAQLKSMRSDKSLNEFTRNQVEENILINSKELEKEVISAIEEIKQSVALLLERKKSLQQNAFDHLSTERLVKSKNVQMNRFSKMQELVSEAKAQYEDATLRWMSCKSSFSLYRVTE